MIYLTLKSLLFIIICLLSSLRYASPTSNHHHEKQPHRLVELSPDQQSHILHARTTFTDIHHVIPTKVISTWSRWKQNISSLLSVTSRVTRGGSLSSPSPSAISNVDNSEGLVQQDDEEWENSREKNDLDPIVRDEILRRPTDMSISRQTSRKRLYHLKATSEKVYSLSVYSIQGKRAYMEDEYFTNQNGSFASIFDGHGGKAVSRYLRQNLYARYLQAFSQAAISTNKPKNDSMIEHERLNRQPTAQDNFEYDDDKQGEENHSDDDTAMAVKICISALTSAFDKVDTEVQQISHWSYQGSTAVAVLFCDAPTSSASARSSSPPHGGQPLVSKQITSSYLIAANVGDSRAVLSRSGRAIELTKDHKPNDPLERERVEKLGGEVKFCGPVHPKTGKPIIRSKKKRSGKCGVYRINGNLALSRAIGDRSERPLVSSEVDVRQFKIDHEHDEFVILGSDGLWDVFESQELVDFCHEVLVLESQRQDNITETENQLRRRVISQDGLAQIIVEEALRRGSMDNISAVIISL